MKINAENLKYYRKQTGLTSQDFAKLCDIPVGTYQSYEAGWRSPRNERLEVIASKLNVTIANLTTSDTEYIAKQIKKGCKPKNSILKERVEVDNVLLRNRRKQLGMRTNDVAKYVGVSESRYREYEQGNGKPTREMARKMCNILNLSFYHLVIS